MFAKYALVVHIIYFTFAQYELFPLNFGVHHALRRGFTFEQSYNYLFDLISFVVYRNLEISPWLY